MKFIDESLKEIEPYSDRVFICPATEDEIAEIESKIGKTLPQYYKYFLRKVGLKQDFVHGLLYAINHFDNLDDFLPSNNFFRFGDNRGEDYLLLKLNSENDRTIYEYYYYSSGKIEPLNKTFDSLLKENIDRIKSNYDRLPLNSEKTWSVEFSLNTASAKFLENSLKDKISITLLEEPKKVKINGETIYEDGKIQIENSIFNLKKWAHSSGQNLSFTCEESIEVMIQNSFIKKIAKALEKCVFSYTMVDYGVLPF